MIHAIIFVLGIFLGIFLVVVSTEMVGSLFINESEEKDVFRFEFTIPPENLIEHKNRRLVFLFIKRENRKNNNSLSE